MLIIIAHHLLNARLIVYILSIHLLNNNVLSALIFYKLDHVLLPVPLVRLDINQLSYHYVDLVFTNAVNVLVLQHAQVVTMDIICKLQIAFWHQIVMLDI